MSHILSILARTAKNTCNCGYHNAIYMTFDKQMVPKYTCNTTLITIDKTLIVLNCTPFAKKATKNGSGGLHTIDRFQNRNASAPIIDLHSGIKSLKTLQQIILRCSAVVSIKFIFNWSRQSEMNWSIDKVHGARKAYIQRKVATRVEWTNNYWGQVGTRQEK